MLLCCELPRLFTSTFTSGGKLKPEQAIMIRHYTIALDVDIAKKFISGYAIIDFNLSQPTNVLLFICLILSM